MLFPFYVIALFIAPHEVADMIVCAVAIGVDDVGQVLGVGDERLCHEAMHLEGLASESDTAVALAVVLRQFVRCSPAVVGQHTSVVGDVVGGLSVVVKLF